MTQKALTDRAAKKLADGWYHDHGHPGLYLQVGTGQSRSWVFRYSRKGDQRYMGLGPLHTISLVRARELARQCREQLLQGLDPLVERQKQRQAQQAEQARAITFKNAAEAFLDLHLNTFRNAKHRTQWRNTMATYAFGKIGGMVIADIQPHHVLACIEPLWVKKQETARRVHQRITRIFDYAITRGFRSGENPARHVIEALPRNTNGKNHHGAIPYIDLPLFVMELRGRDSCSARALEFCILTAARTGEVVGATWDEINFKTKVWTIPANRTKTGREHRVPLADRAIEILQGQDKRTKRPFPLGLTALLQCLQSFRPNSGYTVHGTARSSFMDWAHETTGFPKVVIDMSLGHAVGDKVEAAYRRGDLLEKRRQLMDAWNRFTAREPVHAPVETVVPLRRI
jgi:integrase